MLTDSIRRLDEFDLYFFVKLKNHAYICDVKDLIVFLI